MAQFLEAANSVQCSEGVERAQPVNSVFLMRSLAALIMLQVLSYLLCHAAGKPAVHARRNNTNLASSQPPNKAVAKVGSVKVRFDSACRGGGPG